MFSSPQDKNPKVVPRPPLTLPPKIDLETIDFHTSYSWLPVPAIQLDGDHLIQAVNPAFVKAIKVPEKKLVGRVFWELCGPMISPGQVSAFEQFVQGTESTLESILLFHRTNGTTLRTRVRWKAYRDERGKFLGSVACLVDNSAQAKAQLALRKTTQNLSVLFRNSPLAMINADLGGNILSWNSAAEKLFGWTESEVLGKKSPAIPYDNFSSALAINQKITNGDPIAGYETKRKRKDGRFVDVSIWAYPVYDREGAVTGLTAIFIDISAQKRTEEFLRQSKETAEAANRAKNLFLANLSHEIRTPMAAILGFADILADTNPNTATWLECIRTIRQNGTHLLRLINDLLDLTKLEASQLDIHWKEINAGSEIAEVLSTMLPQAKKKNIQLESRALTEIPSTLISDPLRFRQIMMNLVSNAIRYTPQGKIEIQSNYSHRDKILIVDVIDTGTGISGKDKELLFRPFSRVGTDCRSQELASSIGGAGLGLALSKSLAEALGGSLTLLDSKVGEGSTFRLKILAAGPEEWQKIKCRRESRLPSSPIKTMPSLAVETKPLNHVLSNIKILLAEDSPELRLVLKFYLEKAGATTILAEDGMQAIDLTQKYRPDLVLVDIQMPKLDGYEVTRALRTSGFASPIVALSAYSLNEERQKCLDAGCNEYLSKPVEPQLLLETLARIARFPAGKDQQPSVKIN